MNIVAPPAFTNNPVWMLHDGANAVVVDPGGRCAGSCGTRRAKAAAPHDSSDPPPRPPHKCSDASDTLRASCIDTPLSAACACSYGDKTAQTYHSLSVLNALGASKQFRRTRGHTLTDLQFSAATETEVAAVIAPMQHWTRFRSGGKITMNFQLNPMRERKPGIDRLVGRSKPSIIAAAVAQDDADGTTVRVFAPLGQWKYHHQ